MPNLTIGSLQFLPTVNSSPRRSNSQTSLTTSNCWSLSSNHSTRTAAASVLSRRHTTVTTLFVTLLLFYQVCEFNPIKTCQMCKNNIRKAKSNKIDTYVIAKTFMMQNGLRFVSSYNLDMMDLKDLRRFRQPPKMTHPFENPAYSLC